MKRLKVFTAAKVKEKQVKVAGEDLEAPLIVRISWSTFDILPNEVLCGSVQWLFFS